MKKEPKKLGRIHFVGIGGIGMSGIAELMHKSGYFVQGSDININSNVRRLKSKGVKIFYKHNNKNISNATVVVFSSAIKKNNPEIVEALKRRIPLVSRAEMLGELMKFKRGIAIAGSHGKTTTTSILGGILEEASLDPTIVNGGIINSLHSNSRMGKGEWMVVEADESDGSFLYLPNEINIITNIDFEHLDYYNKFENLYDSFKKFSSQIPFYGSTIICLEDKNTKKLSTEINRREVITYGIKKKESDLNIKSILLNKKQSIFEISLSKKFQSKNKKRITFNLNLLGNHNVLNATAAIAASLKIGIKISIIKKALLNFKGVNRRFTHIANVYNTPVYDDYAHHPKEIEATLNIAKNICKGKIIVIFQPHRFTRTKILYGDFVKVLKSADVLILSNIFSAGESVIKGLNDKFYRDLRNNSKGIVYRIKSENEIYNITKSFFNEKNIIIFMGAGSITNWANNFVKKNRK